MTGERTSRASSTVWRTMSAATVVTSMVKVCLDAVPFVKDDLDMALPQVADLVDLMAREEDPLERLLAAEDLAADLVAIADRLLGSVVDDIRAAGCSWAEI